MTATAHRPAVLAGSTEAGPVVPGDLGPQAFWDTVEAMDRAEAQYRSAARRACLGALVALPAAVRAAHPDAVRLTVVRGRRLRLTAALEDGTMVPVRPTGDSQGPDASRHLECLLGLARGTGVGWTDAVATSQGGAPFLGDFTRTGRIAIHLDATAARAARLLEAEPLPFTLLPAGAAG